MATRTPQEGLEFTTDRLLSKTETDGWEMFQVAVGDGSASLSAGDTQLDNELFRGDRTDSIIDFNDTSIDGEIKVTITLSGGTEVPAGADLTEFAIFAVDPTDAPSDDTEDVKDRLLHRELRSPITLQAGDRKAFELVYVAENR